MSFKGSIFHFILRNRHLLKGQLKPEIISKETSIEKLRADTDAAAKRLVKAHSDILFESSDFPNFYSEWVIPQSAPKDKLILYFHGGGFVMGNACSHRNLVSTFVRTLGLKALVFDYSLAPEHPSPAAVNDSYSIYKWLLDEGYLPENIGFAGDSAGGGILFSTLLKCKNEKTPLPAACLAFSPCTDMTMSGESHISRKKYDPCTPEGANETYLSYYVGDGDPRHPYTSPLFGDLSDLPPIHIEVGNDETLRDDSVLFSQKAIVAGSPVSINVWKGMFHCFSLMAPMFPEATKSLNQSCDFMRNHMKVNI
ncbi:alpha/beta hydrolase [Eubacteriaceae bacterium ES3]|nr:alpha/beta hydrolase [Eubacteriaceae bacterium ES3]